MPRAFVAGASGAVGESVVRHLLQSGWTVTASMHRRRPDVAARLRGAGAAIAMHDLDRDADWTASASDSDAWIFITRLERTMRALACAERLPPRIVAFSSNNVAVHPEAPAYRALAAAEAALRQRAPCAAILRPTMIYGDRRLSAVTRLLQLARWSPLLPLPGSGEALTQPVFADDLGRLAAGLAGSATAGVYAVGGPDVVSMRSFFAAIALAVGSSPLIAPTPPALLQAAAWLPFLAFSKAQAERTERDRIAAPQTPLPPELVPRTALRGGLQAHLAAVRGASGKAPALARRARRGSRRASRRSGSSLRCVHAEFRAGFSTQRLTRRNQQRGRARRPSRHR
ncbi:MAG: NmrA family NAD(P)-binding protein [Proteobacteria bacterium]|nr:NmrA family NAD(P)-binding protein [Pseudomonadota bacterium]